MVPDLDLQLQVVLKALADNIKPAVDPADKVAVEQLHLAIATLTMVRERLPVYRAFIRRLLEDDLAMAGDIVSAAGESAALEAAMSAAKAALADPEMDARELELARNVLTGETVSVIAGINDGPGVAALMPVVLKRAKPQLERLRAWCVSSGFEPNPDEFRTLSELI